jgi:hypothetical protein
MTGLLESDRSSILISRMFGRTSSDLLPTPLDPNSQFIGPPDCHMDSAHLVELATILFVAFVGYALGKSDLRIDPAITAVTVVVAIILHGVWQLALPHQALELIARAVARSPRSITLVVVALAPTGAAAAGT